MKKNNWIIKVFLITFILSITFTFLTNTISNNTSIIFNIIIMFLVIFIGIFFDMIGTAVLTCNEASFHAMSSKKVRGSKIAIKFIKNNNKVASFCNDIVGDICGIISGGLGAVLAISLADKFNITLVTIIISAVISSLTVGGKAIFKTIAIKNADNIIYFVSKILSVFSKN